MGVGNGCGGSEPPAPGIVIALDAEPQSLDPRLGLDANASRVADLLHISLTRSAPSGERIGELAGEWRLEDPTTLVLTLRDDFRFADGTFVTAEDVRATYEAIRDPAMGSPRRIGLDAVAAVEARDHYTLAFRLHRPFPPVLEATGLPVLPAAEARAPGVPTGAGPYRLAAVASRERIVLEPNPYWPGTRASGPLTLRVVPDPVMRVLELRRGSIHLLQETFEPEILSALAREPGLRVRRSPGSSVAYLAVSHRDPRLADRRVRQAIALALDRPGLTRFALGDAGRPATGLLPPEHWAYAPLPPPRHDPARARRLLDRAGRPDPDGAGPLPRFRIVLKTSSQPARRRFGEAVQAALAEVGIAVDVRTYEWGVLFADVRNGNFEMAALAWVGITEPDHYFLTLHSTMVPPAGYNRGSYRSAVMDRLVTRARYAPTPAERRRWYARVQRRAARDLPVIPLWWEDRVVVHDAALHGFEPAPGGELRSLAGAELR
ncbi:MAG TPA: ABC transporter substrate-binding protein [Candidatus Limnocylindria bacterium]|nr:ABC transporter substrate-binding protein [Candidatus Limnocylindria bacterium]